MRSIMNHEMFHHEMFSPVSVAKTRRCPFSRTVSYFFGQNKITARAGPSEGLRLWKGKVYKGHL